MTRLTRKQKEELVKELYEQGYTYREIAKKLRISVRDISQILKGVTRKDEIDEIKERLQKLEERIDNASFMIRHALGDADIQIRCPHCHQWTLLRLIKPKGMDEEKWACPLCGEVPF